jgi:hypothetical protein
MVKKAKGAASKPATKIKPKGKAKGKTPESSSDEESSSEEEESEEELTALQATSLLANRPLVDIPKPTRKKIQEIIACVVEDLKNAAILTEEVLSYISVGSYTQKYIMARVSQMKVKLTRDVVTKIDELNAINIKIHPTADNVIQVGTNTHPGKHRPRYRGNKGKGT